MCDRLHDGCQGGEGRGGGFVGRVWDGGKNQALAVSGLMGLTMSQHRLVFVPDFYFGLSYCSGVWRSDLNTGTPSRNTSRWKTFPEDEAECLRFRKCAVFTIPPMI